MIQELKVYSFKGGHFEQNVYFIYNRFTGLVVDPGHSSDLIISKIKEAKVNRVIIFLTHGHYDHYDDIYSLSLLEGVKVDIFLSANDLSYLPKDLAKIIETNFDNDSFLPFDVELISTSGHTPGSMCLLLKDCNCLFSGDTLFHNDVGRTDLKGGDEKALLDSLQVLMNKLDDSVTIYPGHDESSNIKSARKYLKERYGF